MKMQKRRKRNTKKKKSRRKENNCKPARRNAPQLNRRDIPTYDFFENMDLNDHGELEELIGNFIFKVRGGDFMLWEAVIRDEQGLPLTEKQEDALSELVSFGDDEDDMILYINDMPRPSQTWYQILEKLAKHLLLDKFATEDVHYDVITQGWPNLVAALEERGDDLSLPDDVRYPIDVVPAEIRHKLWLQSCFDVLIGLGQAEEVCLEDKEEHYRIESFVDSLKDCKDSVQFLDLSLDKLFRTLILPHKDRQVFVRMMIDELGMASAGDRIAEYL